MLNKALSFDDVLLVPRFSEIESRSWCDTSITINGVKYSTPIMSANMDTVTGIEMATALNNIGAIPAYHRFVSIDENVKMFEKAPAFVSIGAGKEELKRAVELHKVGARNFIIDIAHGASVQAANTFKSLTLLPDVFIVVGNFATPESYEHFVVRSGGLHPNAIKIGVGSGSMCSTRIVTGFGLPTLESLLQFKNYQFKTNKWPLIIADGGIKNSGDIAKSIAAGASIVMIGSLLAGTEESPGKKITVLKDGQFKHFKEYRGSASMPSYVSQGKVAQHRAPEGEATLVNYKGSALNVIEALTAGLKSAISYAGGRNIYDLQRVKMVEISNAGLIESKPHGVK